MPSKTSAEGTKTSSTKNIPARQKKRSSRQDTTSSRSKGSKTATNPKPASPDSSTTTMAQLNSLLIRLDLSPSTPGLLQIETGDGTWSLEIPAERRMEMVLASK